MLPGERKVDLLKNLADSSPYTSPQGSRQILPSVVQLLKKYMPQTKVREEMNFTYVECLLYTFHHLASKAPNATNSLCGYKIVTGQPSDRLGEDFSDCYKDFTERLSCVEELARATMKKLTQGMVEHNKALTAAKSDEAKADIKSQRQNATTGLRTCNNILTMTQPLHSKSPSFVGDKRINLSWKEAVKPLAPSNTTVVGCVYRRHGAFSSRGQEGQVEADFMELAKKKEKGCCGVRIRSLMAYSIIDEIQIRTREQAEYSPARLSQVPAIPSLSGNIVALDDNNNIGCKHCKGRLLGGVHSLICIYCSRLNDSSLPPLPIFFKDTIAYSWLLHSLNLHGSEMVEPYAEKNETARGQGAPPNKERLSLFELLNFQISFRAELDEVESDVKTKEFGQRNSFTLWNGIELDDFFLESERETSLSMSEKPVICTQVQFEGTKPVATDDNPYSYQHASSASNAVEDHELSGWQADFQPADNGVQNTSHLSGTSAAHSVDLSTHLDSVFGSGKDSKDEISITSDELRNNMSSVAFPQSLDFDVSQSGSNNQMQNKVEKTSTSGDWFQAGDWGTNNVDQPNKAITTDVDNSFAEWNDFTSSTNVQNPSGSVFAESNIPGAISHEKPSDLFNFDDQYNDMDVSGFGRSDLFSDPFSKNDEKLEVNNISAGVSSSKRLADLTSVVEDGSERGAVNVEYSNARGTNTTEDVEALVSQMHDLSFMLTDDLTIPTKSTDSHNSSL